VISLKLLVSLAVCSFVIALVLTPLVRRAAILLGFVDQPDAERKLHPHPVPRLGGIAIAIAYVASIALMVLFASEPTGRIVTEHLSLVLKLLPAAATMFVIGLLDDVFSLSPLQKLAGQVAASGWAYWAGVRILSVGDHSTEWWSLPLTVIWLVACTNAFNLIDGLDGLAAGIGLLSTLTITLVAIIHGNIPLAVATVPLAGAILGFGKYNIAPASIFLGDCGSLLIGFLLGCMGVIWSQKSATILGMMAPLIALAVPVLDVSLSIARRFLRGQPIFTGDRGHIHHRLLAQGLTPRNVALVMYAACGVAAAISLVGSVAGPTSAPAVILAFCGIVWFAIRKLKYVEFGVAQKMFLADEFRSILNAKIRLRVFEESMARASNLDECWRAVRDASRDFGFTSVSAHLQDKDYSEEFSPPEQSDGWRLKTTLDSGDFVDVRHSLDATIQAMIVVPFLEIVQQQLEHKVAASMGAVVEPPKLLASQHAAAR
jgi:UDP-GlcNAc:undecaprenyl-phosphate GlcNAc-1-phosphate transferase